jgi:hypothetical protein
MGPLKLELKGMKTMRWLGMLMLLVLPGVYGACQQTTMFQKSDTYTRSRIDRYWDGDSAIQTRENRSKASEMGFGFPTGMANQ